jgi:hypothetical protein
MALAELETVVFQGGVEYFLSDSLSWQGEIGFNSGVFGANAGRDQNSDFSFIHFRTEVKWYLSRSYLAAEVFVLAKDFNRQNDFFFNGKIILAMIAQTFATSPPVTCLKSVRKNL